MDKSAAFRSTNLSCKSGNFGVIYESYEGQFLLGVGLFPLSLVQNEEYISI